ncbi:MAG: tetratricopeptide repeat protein [Spirochaetales bacterium]|jgi:tetratricopeptide (TPR) repeat protein|nr:tetratricopeptide repeat protein [Spirochaetales bacterium]
MIVLTAWFQNTGLIFAQDLSYESDMGYILTKYYIIRDYEEVLRLLNKHYSGYQSELAYLYGLCYLKLNMNKIAIDYFTITLAEHENNYEVLNNIGVAYFQENDYINAMKYFHLSFISNTDYEIAQENYNIAYDSWIAKRRNESVRPMIPFTEKPTMYNSLGWFYYYSGDYHNAIYYFKKSIEEDRKYQFAYIALAYIYDEGNNFELALNYLREAEKIDENNPDLYNNLGIVYYHLSDYENSENSFRKAILLNYRFAEPYNNLGFLYFEKADYSLAEEYFRKSIEINPDNQSLRAESMAGLAIINMKNKNTHQSRVYKESSMRLDYRMNDIKYLTNKLKWSAELIEIWGTI